MRIRAGLVKIRIAHNEWNLRRYIVRIRAGMVKIRIAHNEWVCALVVTNICVSLFIELTHCK